MQTHILFSIHVILYVYSSFHMNQNRIFILSSPCDDPNPSGQTSRATISYRKRG